MEGASFDAAPPPPSGLGNFKGVMLCNRPSEDTGKTGGGGGEEPFRSMIAASYSDAPGLQPARNFEPTVKKRGPSAALRRHVRWLRELQDQMREEREQVEAEEQDEDTRRLKMKTVVDGHREKVRAMMQERDAKNREEEEQKQAAKTAARLAAAPGSTVPVASESGHAEAAKPKPKASKPLWAMTEQEKDKFEESEADDLINFAENLDFDKFVGDLEFRQGLDALKDRAGKLKREQDSFKDELLANFNTSVDDEDYEASTNAGSLEDGIDGQSLLGSEYSVASSRRVRKERHGDGDDGWDNSTNAGDDRPVVDRDVSEMAEVVLQTAPQIRAVHSKASVEKLIQKAKQKKAIEEEDMDLVSFMAAEGPCPVPVITASSDVQNRLHKPVDPSALPYLYRSPAV